MNVFERRESEVRSYCRAWPAVFQAAQGSQISTEDGRTFLDFFAGAGSLNYGHNNPAIKSALIDYLHRDAIVHSLDMHTVAKREFLEAFEEIILGPRHLDYKVQFPGPTGTNAVEAALKLARKVTGRETIVNFTNAFHGMTLGSLAVTGNAMKRGGAGVPLGHTVTMPFDNYLDGRTPDFLLLETMLTDDGSGLDRPAAVIVETIQGEGGVNPARVEWLRGLEALCRRHGILLIVDDVQMGCGRTGPFFSFEDAGITPDIICLSKSLSGYGLPFAVTLFRRELDQWNPGEHNGTFRGFNPAFVTARAALDFWLDDETEKRTISSGVQVELALRDIAATHGDLVRDVRGRGLAWGLELVDETLAGAVCAAAFERGLLLETSGPRDEVVKLLPPLTIGDDELATGLDRLADAVQHVLATQPA